MSTNFSFNIGDRVRINAPLKWPGSPGHRFVNAEGTITASEYNGAVMDDYEPFLAHVLIEKADGAAKEYIGNAFWFLVKELEKI